MPDCSDHPSSEIAIQEDGVLRLLQTIKVNKSCGPDNIQGHLLKEHALLFTLILTLFRALLKQGAVPYDWKTAYIIAPLHKKGDRSLLCNYRPVFLTSICCTVLEHIIYTSIFSHNHILCDNQHDFQKRRSCETQLINTIDDLAKCLNNGKQADVILLDFIRKPLIKFPTQDCCINFIWN